MRERKTRTPKVKLNRRQRMQIRIRRLEMLSMYNALLLAICMFVLYLVGSAGITLYQNYIAKKNTPDVVRDPDTVLVADFAGDVMLGRSIKSVYERKGYKNLYTGVAPYWENADLIGVNLESAVLKKEEEKYTKQDKNINLFCSYDAVDSLVDAGVNFFSCANNHSYDYTGKAVIDLIDYFHDNSISFAGIGKNRDEASAYYIQEINGVKVAIVSITDVYYKVANARVHRSGVNSTANSDYNLIVNQAAQEADLTIVYVHFGEENEISANEEQSRMAHQFIDAGANVVIGSHPHVVQRAERYRDGMIFYSLGNFIFDQGNTFSRDSIMVQMTVNKKGICEFEVIPLRIYSGTPTRTDGIYAKRINHEITAGVSEEDYYYNEAGHVVFPAFSISFERKLKPEKGETYSKWENSVTSM